MKKNPPLTPTDIKSFLRFIPLLETAQKADRYLDKEPYSSIINVLYDHNWVLSSTGHHGKDRR